MHLQLADWTIQLLPPLTLFRPETLPELRIGLALAGGVGIIFLLLNQAIARWFGKRRRQAHRMLSAFTSVALFAMLLRLAYLGKTLPFAPLYPLAALALLIPILLLLLSGSWTILRLESTNPPSGWSSIRAGLWYSLLHLLPLTVLLLLAIPMIDTDGQRLYLVPLGLAVLAFLLFSRWLRGPALDHLGLRVRPENLAPALQHRLREATSVLVGTPTIHLIGPGFRNGLALFPGRHILLGQDLLELLTVEQLQATLLHEQGHLEDRQAMPWLYRLVLMLPLFLLIHALLVQADLLGGPLGNLACLLLGLSVLVLISNRLRLRAEFLADRFVHDQAPHLDGALVEAVQVIYGLNGVDPDHCKKHNHAHLDPDERRRMLAEGSFQLQRRPVRIFFRRLALWICIGGVTGVGYAFVLEPMLKSDVEKWRSLHVEYHAYKYTDQQAAYHAITKARDLAISAFGADSREVYLAQNDLTDLHLLHEQTSEALASSALALQLGRQLYPDDLDLVRSLVNRGIALASDNEPAVGVEFLQQALDLQDRLGDTAENRVDTLYELAQIYLMQDAADQAIACYTQSIRLLEASDGEDQADQLLLAYSLLIETQYQAGRLDQALASLEAARTYMQTNFGPDHALTVELTCQQAEFLNELPDRRQQTLQGYLDCLAGYTKLEWADPDSILCYRSTLAELLLEQQRYGEAAEQARQALALEEQLSQGEASQGKASLLELLATIAMQQGEQDRAFTYRAEAQRLRASDQPSDEGTTP